MRIDLDKLFIQLSSTEADERILGIRILQEDLSKGEPDLTPDAIQILDRIAYSDVNQLVRNEAQKLLERTEYINLCKRLGITLRTAMTQETSETPKLTFLPLSKFWKVFFILLVVFSVTSFLLNAFGICITFGMGGIRKNLFVDYLIFISSLVCDIVFWILLLKRWYAGWRKAVLILLATLPVLIIIWLGWLQ